MVAAMAPPPLPRHGTVTVLSAATLMDAISGVDGVAGDSAVAVAAAAPDKEDTVCVAPTTGAPVGVEVDDAGVRPGGVV